MKKDPNRNRNVPEKLQPNKVCRLCQCTSYEVKCSECGKYSCINCVVIYNLSGRIESICHECLGKYENRQSTFDFACDRIEVTA